MTTKLGSDFSNFVTVNNDQKADVSDTKELVHCITTDLTRPVQQIASMADLKDIDEKNKKYTLFLIAHGSEDGFSFATKHDGTGSVKRDAFLKSHPNCDVIACTCYSSEKSSSTQR
eukprot:TRINITY_DN10459_c0_g1_i1.p1 TRINITY_DN10459_c0_g1~~TRINITY_DN10459_c0_g1_i1.p1  ORF type:complete len:126 (-),score=3.35 TRINITY_DN10459_c0_g1_i1:1-348(-)